MKCVQVGLVFPVLVAAWLQTQMMKTRKWWIVVPSTDKIGCLIVTVPSSLTKR